MKKTAMGKRFPALAGSFLALALVLFPVSARAGEAEDVLQKIREKFEKFESGTSDMAMVMDIEAKTPSETVTMEQRVFRKGEKTRTETFVKSPVSGKPENRTFTILINDGRQAWIMSPLTGRRQLPGDARPSADESWWRMLIEVAKVTGQEKVGGRDAYLILVEGGKEAPGTRIWVDKTSLVLLRAESALPDGKPARWEFSDFRKAGQWELPYRTEMYIEGQLAAVTVVKSVELDSGLSDDLFDLGKPLPWEEQND